MPHFIAEINDKSAAVWFAAFTFLTLLVNSANTWLANWRQEKALKAHGDAGRKDIKEDLQGTIQTKTKDIQTDIKENTTISQTAFNEANSYNVKIASIAKSVQELAVKVELMDRVGTDLSQKQFIIMEGRFDKIEELLIHPPTIHAVIPATVVSIPPAVQAVLDKAPHV